MTFDTNLYKTIWIPLIGFVNQRDKPVSFETKLDISNTGMVSLYERYTGMFYSKFDIHDFPLTLKPSSSN